MPTLFFQISTCGLIEFERAHLPLWKDGVSVVSLNTAVPLHVS